MNALLILSDVAFLGGVAVFAIAVFRAIARSGYEGLFFVSKHFVKREKGEGERRAKRLDLFNARLFLFSGLSVALSAATYLLA